MSALGITDSTFTEDLIPAMSSELDVGTFMKPKVYLAAATLMSLKAANK